MTTKFLKQLASTLITISSFLLGLQLVLATIFEFLSLDIINVFKDQPHLEMSFAQGLPYWLALVLHNGLWIYGLKVLKGHLTTFKKSDLLTSEFTFFLKKSGLLLAMIAVLKSILVYGMSDGTFHLDMSLSVYLVLAGFACDYARRYMTKHGLTLS